MTSKFGHTKIKHSYIVLIHLYLTGQPQPLMYPTQPVYQAAAVDMSYGYPIMFPPSPYRQLSPMMVRYLRALISDSELF